jgi:membrane-associated phospholipid phosphatase
VPESFKGWLRATLNTHRGVPLALAACLAVCGSVISRGELDQRWCLIINQWQRPWPYPWEVLTWSALGIVAFFLITALSSRQPRRVAALLMAVVVGGLWVHAVKRLVLADRPLVFYGLDHPTFHVLGDMLRAHGMPSGHSVSAMAMAGLMCLGLNPAQSVWRRSLWVAIVVGAHWPSDVLVGGAIGMAVAPMVWHMPFTARLGAWFSRPMPRRVLALLVPALAVGLLLVPQGCEFTPPVAGLILLLGAWGGWQWWQSARDQRLGATP